VAERLQPFRGQTLVDDDFQRLGNLTIALVALEIDDGASLVDLDNPQELATRDWRPSAVASRERVRTQQQARRIFDEGATGFTWWSTLLSHWTNVTLFHERALPLVTVVAPPSPLSTRMIEVRRAADELGIEIGK
jgi:hypothetical protein